MSEHHATVIKHYQDPMTSRAPHKKAETDEETVIESPWRTSMLGNGTSSQESKPLQEEP